MPGSNKHDTLTKLLENTRGLIREGSNSVDTSRKTLTKVILPVLRHVLPELVADDIIGVGGRGVGPDWIAKQNWSILGVVLNPQYIIP